MLQTERMELRNLRATDAETLYRYRNDPRCSQYQRYDDTDLKALEAFTAAFSVCVFPSRGEEQHYAVTRRPDGEMIGDVSVFFSEKDRCYTLGITIAPRFQRQGYAYEMLHALCACLRQQDPSFDLVALIDPENAASIGLFTKLGFRLECYADSIRSDVFVLYAGKNASA